MNCAVCNRPIDRFGGYYLVGATPYCSNCFQSSGRHCDAEHPTQPPAVEWEPENGDLLEAFRAFQKRGRTPARQRH